jgi:hypothetical protein
MNLDEHDLKNLDDLEAYEKMRWFVDVKSLQTGASFGELGLINNYNRAATIHCYTNCYFATLNCEDFSKVLRKVEMRLLNIKIDFLK